ncbi:MAG: alkaline phosphatase PhoX, partial [Microcystaceae cyanobacterium]
MSNLPFDTNQPSQIKPLEGYRVDPLFTVGETLGDYTPIGILDGTGAFSLNDTTVRVLVNHEVSSDVGYKYTLASGVALTGARISYFDLDKRTLQIVDSGLAFDTIYNRAGQKVTPTT